MKFQIGAMTVGDILDRGLKMLLANLPAFYLINLMVLWPIIVFQIILPMLVSMDSATDIMFGGLIGFVMLMILLVVLQPIGTAAILHIISQDFVDHRVNVGSAFRFALSRFGILLWTSILTALIVGVGMVLCLAPGLVLLVLFAFYAQIVVVEGLSGTSALSRSMALTKGYRWRVVGVLFLLFIISSVISLPVNSILQQVLPSYDQVPVPKMKQFDLGFKLVPIYFNLIINVIVAQLINILVQTYGAVCTTLLYFDLRIRKEGFDLEIAAREQQVAEHP